ncbi:unnamed protein product [Paramecium pentaurelia]|uniref:Cytochrome P450 n=1 Tax=Paramecium pentaurelia TaxID=43138 RepID=A0A8S1VNJ0_9CILI|nr:unnamed protein product [Paramecium pentaurelia]
MLYWILLLISIVAVYLIVNPLITMIRLKIKFGNAVYCKYLPIFGIIQVYRKSFKLTGNVHQWIVDIVIKHPEVKFVVANSINKPIIVIIDSEYYKHIYQDHHLVTKHDQSGIKDFLLSGGLLFTEGPKWKQQRNLLGDHFLFQKLKARIPMINLVTKEKINEMANVEKVFEFICSITGEVVIRSFFGEEAEGWKINGKEAQIELGSILASFIKLRVTNFFVYFKQKLLGVKSWQYCTKKEKEIMDRVIKLKKDIIEVIFKRRDKIKQQGHKQEGGDFLDLYLKIFMEQNVYSSDRIETDEIVSQFITLFLAGTDTTGALVANSLLLISENKQYLQELRNEVKNVIGNGDITSENINQLVFIESFLKEVLRLKPSVVYPIARKAKSNIQIKDLYIKKGTILLLGNFLANISTQNYDNPLEFNPRRWLQQKTIKQDNGFINIPFAAGPRNCIGQHMAMIEARIILAHIVRNYDIIRNSQVPKAQWPARGTQTYLPDNAVHLVKI